MLKYKAFVKLATSCLTRPYFEPVQARGPAPWFGKTTGCETGTAAETHCAAADAASSMLLTTATTQVLAIIEAPTRPIIVRSLACFGPAPACYAMVRRSPMERPQTQSNARYLLT